MPRKLIRPEIIQLFAAVTGIVEGYWSDEISIDKMIIEANYCPNCHRSLEYKAFSNMTEYRSFGICTPCRFAREFWLDSVVVANFKKKICRAVAAGRPAK